MGETYRFGPFEFRPRDYVLTRDGAPVHLSPKAFDTLRLLVEGHGHVVEKAALIAALWPDSIVEEANLSVQVAAVRKALGHAGDADRYIETVPKRGYRFVATVTTVESPAAVMPAIAAGAVTPLVTVVVLRLKILRGHPDADFLAFSLPDAIAASLADRPNLVVRSPLAAERHGGPDADLSTLAVAMHARFALTGTLTHIDGRIAVRLQLLEVPAGTVMWSDSRAAAIDDLFTLQDTVAAAVASALLASVGASPARALRDLDVPANAGAYAFYLRANQLAYEVSHWAQARDLYRASLESDPTFAPAWARLARCERLIGKFSASAEESAASLAGAEAAFQRAVALNPDLSIGHSLHAQLMIDAGRAADAMQQLLTRARQRPADPALYAGLVHALRYCGLLDASVAAHQRAQALDPSMPTSVHHTWWMLGDFDRALGETFGDIGYMQGLSLASLGRERDAIAALRWRERETTDNRIRPYLTSLRALLEGDHEKSLAAANAAARIPIDAEAIYYLARTFARLGAHDRAAAELRRVVDGGFWCHETLLRDPWLESIRGRPDLRPVFEQARVQTQRARAIFNQSGGADLLRSRPDHPGVTSAPSR